MKHIIIFSLIFSFFILRPATGQAAIDPKEQISIILFSGLGGAILGLSTLSFYEQPQNHLRNIAVGGAVALIGSVVFTTVYAAKQSKAETESSMREEGGAIESQKGTKEEKGADGKKKKKAPKSPQDNQNPGTQQEDDSNSGDDGAMLDLERNDIKVKIFMADCSGPKLSFDPFFLYVGTSATNRYGESALSFYSRIVEINF